MAKLGATSKQTAHEEKELLTEIWSKAVDTQMHFNEMSAKSRQLGLTFVAAALGVAIVLLSRKEDFVLNAGPFQLHASVLVTLVAAVALLAVRRLDLGVYHRMLRGAVTFGEDFERQYMKRIFDLDKGMTQTISHYSRFSDANYVTSEDGKYKYTGTKKKSAELKIKAFYNWTTIALVAAAMGLFLLTNHAMVERILGVPQSVHLSGGR